ncbi:MAG TPA: START-like domain-containing protein [Bacteroidia bacterium]|nr:START-like domain-containing protein [Bacteroidia bacterium]
MAAKKKIKKSEKKTSKKSTKSKSLSLKKKTTKPKPSKKITKKKTSSPKKSSTKTIKKAATKKLSKKVSPKKNLKKKISKPTKKLSSKKVVKPKPKKTTKSKSTKITSKTISPKLKSKNTKLKTTPSSAKKEISSTTKVKKESKTITGKPKLTKADAAKHTPKKQYIEQITIEKVLEETKEEKFLPQSLNTSSENTGFSDNLPTDLSSVYSQTTDDLPEPPGKYTLEFVFRVSPELLYKFLTDPIELTEWFCDDVNIRNGIYTFVWNGVPSQARLVKQERNQLVRFHWVEKNDGSYFEFAIHKNLITGDVVLYITDFSSDEELESNKLWWNNQISKLKGVLGLH